jgi:hypothetical protein
VWCLSGPVEVFFFFFTKFSPIRPVPKLHKVFKSSLS